MKGRGGHTAQSAELGGGVVGERGAEGQGVPPIGGGSSVGLLVVVVDVGHGGGRRSLIAS